MGFGVDKVSLYEKIEYIKSDQEHKELYPYCVLLCLTSDGKLIMFHAARYFYKDSLSAGFQKFVAFKCFCRKL